MGYDTKATWYFLLYNLVKCDSTTEDIGLSDGSIINMLWFGWLFTGLDLHCFDQWGPPHLSCRIYNEAFVRVIRRREIRLGCVSRNQVIIDQEEEYIGQLIGMLVGDHGGIY